MKKPPPQPRPAAETPTELTVGLRACLAVFQVRPEDIREVAWSPSTEEDADPLLAWAEANDIPLYRMSDAELEEATENGLHEGLALRAKPRSWTSPKALAEHLARERGVAVAFDRVRNPYNIGAILRSAAFLGAEGALFGALAQGPSLPTMALRVAEGGAEHLRLARTSDLAASLAEARARKVRVFGADGAAKVSAFTTDLSGPSILVLGHEREGLSDRVRAQCDALIAIPGTGHVESLNVGIAAGILLGRAMA